MPVNQAIDTKARYEVVWYSYYGELSTERFSSWSQMDFFKRQLKAAQVLSYGEIEDKSAVSYRVAA
ncbi:MAG: hypothetical protein ACJ74Z_19875 [Bryobacteraceae bacterium]|jgi:hypothetical protein